MISSIEDQTSKLVQEIQNKIKLYEKKNKTHQRWNIALTLLAIAIAAIITLNGIVNFTYYGLTSGQVAGILTVLLSAIAVTLRVFPFSVMEIFYRDAVATLDSLLIALDSGIVKTESDYKAIVEKFQFIVERVGRDIPRGEQLDAVLDMRRAQLGDIRKSEDGVRSEYV